MQFISYFLASRELMIQLCERGCVIVSLNVL